MDFLLISFVADIVKEILDPYLIGIIVLLGFSKCATCNSGLGFEERFLYVFVTDLLRRCLFFQQCTSPSIILYYLLHQLCLSCKVMKRM